MKCGKVCCKNKAKEYGVCGVHKTLAFKFENIDFERELENYSKLVRAYKREAEKMSKNGVDILSINPLTCTSTDERLKFFSRICKAQIYYCLDMQKRYDPYLVSNSTSRVSHKILNAQCDCPICGLI
jgi:hypothetical protein